MVRTKRWKYIYYGSGEAELYDLRDDPRERHDLASDPGHMPIVDELQRRLLTWLITADDVDQLAPRWLIPKS
jgi:arylsulfatase A-like enzyme